jgi:flavorubredoxin
MAREFKSNIYAINIADWNRRLFDSLIPLPDGTSYNAYVVKGSEKTALIDTSDPDFSELFFEKLEPFQTIDYIVSQHSEQDHSGLIPAVLERFPKAKVIVSPRGKDIILTHLTVSEEQIVVVEDGEELSLGDKTLQFIHFPWVHWPETMLTYLKEDQVLFSCDFLGSHLATTDLYASDSCQVYEAAKRYFSEIMMPFRRIISRNLSKLDDYTIDLVAPSHGPIYPDPKLILDAYRDWTSDETQNSVVIPYISMHGSVEKMVDRLIKALETHGIKAYKFDLSVTDIGKLAITLVDATTVVIGTPTVLAEPHPLVSYAALLVNLLKPKIKYLSVLGSYAWGGKAVDKLVALTPNLQVEVIPPLMIKGAPTDEDLAAVEEMAAQIALKHQELGLID